MPSHFNLLKMQYKAKRTSFNEIKRFSPFPCSLLLELFPFGIIINPDMKIMGVGEKLAEIWSSKETFLSKSVGCYFKLRRPKGITFSWKNVILNNSVLSFFTPHFIIDAQFAIRNVRTRV